MMEGEQVLNVAMENCEEERQPFNVVTKKERGNGQSVMTVGNETNREGGKIVRQTSSTVTVKEDHSFILIQDTEYCVEFSVEISSELTNLWEELMILEERLRNQQNSIRDVKLELEKDGGVVIAGNDEKNTGIHGKNFMVGKFNIYYDQSYVDMENEEGKMVLKDNNVEQISVEQKYDVAEGNILEENYVSNDIGCEGDQLLEVVVKGRRNAEEEVVLRDNVIVQNRAEEDEEISNSEFVVQKRRKALEVFYTSRQMKVEMEKDIQTEVFQNRSILDEEADELWHLMQRSKKNNGSKIQTIIWMIVEDCEGHCRVNEQLQLSKQIYISKADDDLQNKVWDPGGLKTTVT